MDERAVKSVVKLNYLDQKDPIKDEKTSKKSKKKLKETAKKVMKDKSRKTLGKMNKDIAFLQQFLEQQQWRETQENTNSFVSNLATDALEYLEERQHFWEQTIVKSK